MRTDYELVDEAGCLARRVAATASAGDRCLDRHQTRRLVFVFPLQYRPLNANFARRFEKLAGMCQGYIFTIAGQRHRGLRIGDFLFYADTVDTSGFGGLAWRLWFQAFFPLKVLPKGTHVDAVVSYDPYGSGLAGSILSTLLRTRLIVEINGDFHRSGRAPHFAKRCLMRLALAISLRSADALKVLNRDQEAFFRRLHPSKRIFRFANFVADEYFQSLDCYQGDYLLSVGHPYDLKGMDVLIRAFRLVSGRHPGIRLRIMGYCPREELVRYREMASDQPAIEFVPAGWIEDVGEMMRGCYALVNAARSEALGRVHLEAMACQKPIVATRTNGGKECVDDGVTGFLCEIDNAEDLAVKLDSLLGNADLAARMGRAGRERLQRMYSEQIYTRAFVSMIEDVLAAEGRV